LYRFGRAKPLILSFEKGGAMKAVKKGTEDTPVFSDEERAAMKEYIREKRGGSRRDPADGGRELLEKIAAMPQPDSGMAERIHAIVKANAPELAPRTWYGMPAWAKDGNVVCFFQSSQKFKTRYSTLGFSDQAHLDDGQMWPSAFAVAGLGPEEEKKIAALVKKAAG
jgi:uncharacterized protein YdhG (YjbR/CyaY superfamily)